MVRLLTVTVVIAVW